VFLARPCDLTITILARPPELPIFFQARPGKGTHSTPSTSLATASPL
jgi:hypothetical protein